MSTRLKFTALAAATLLAFAGARAEDTTPSADKVMEILTSKLNLTEAQKSAIAPVIADRQEKLKALRADGAAPRSHRREARAIFADSDRKISAVLSPDQQQQYKELERQMIERVRQQSAAQ